MARRRWGGWVSARMLRALGRGARVHRSGGCTDCGTTCVQRFCGGGLVSLEAPRFASGIACCILPAALLHPE